MNKLEEIAKKKKKIYRHLSSEAEQALNDEEATTPADIWKAVYSD